jgi:hypothetical protein
MQELRTPNSQMQTFDIWQMPPHRFHIIQPIENVHNPASPLHSFDHGTPFALIPPRDEELTQNNAVLYSAPPETSMTYPVAKTLREDPVSLNIVRFLLKNRQAMDSTKGIAAWWVNCDEVAAQSAIDRLISCGILNAYTFKSCTLYGLTPNSEIRGWLETWFNGHGPPSKSRGASSKKKATQPTLGSTTVFPSTDQSNQ